MKTAIIALLAALSLINIPAMANLIGFALLLGAIASLIAVTAKIVRNYNATR